MKTSILVFSAALLASVVTLILVRMTPAPSTQTQIEAMVDSRLSARELAFVQGITPKLKSMLAGMDDSKFGDSWSPKTMEELFVPIIRIIETMGEDAEHAFSSDGDKPPK